MKRNWVQVLAALIMLLPLSMKALAAEQTYVFDSTHSDVLWHVSHFGYSQVSGKWYVDGTLVLDQDNLKKSKVNVTVKVTDLVTGLKALDEHLTGKDFLNASQFPTATFASNKVEVTGKNTAKVTGILTVHGVSKPITLNMTLNKMGINSFTKKDTIGFSGTTTLKRSDFGITSYLPAIGDEVKLEIQVEAYKPTAERAAG